MNQYRKLALNTVLFAVGNIGSRSISFLLLPVLTRYLLPEHYGKLDIINTTLSLISPFLSLGIAEAIVRYTVDSMDISKKRLVLSNSLIVTILSSLAFFPLYFLLSRVGVFNEFYLYFILLYVSSLILGELKQFLRGMEKILVYAIGDIVLTVLYAFFTVLFLVKLGMGLQGCLIATILSNLGGIAYLFFFGKIYLYLELRLDIPILKEMLKYSLPLVLNGMMWWIINVSDRYMLTYFKGYEATGIYSVSTRFPHIITALYGVFFLSWQLSAMQEYGKENFEHFFERVFDVVLSFTSILVSWFLVFMKPFVQLFVGREYIDSWTYVPFLTLGTLFYILVSFYGVIYTASKKTSGAMLSTTIGAIVNISINLFLIPLFGIQAAAISTFVAYSVTFLIRVYHAKKISAISISHGMILITLTVILLIQSILLIAFGGSWIIYVLEICLAFLITLIQRKIVFNFTKYIFKEIRNKMPF